MTRREVTRRQVRRWTAPNLLERISSDAIRRRIAAGTATPTDLERLADEERRRRRIIDVAMEACRGRRWSEFLGLLTRPQRFPAFSVIETHLTDAEYWMTLRGLLTDGEDLWRHAPRIRRFLGSSRPERDQLMNEKERAVLAALPDLVTVYRGAQHGINERGFSWTRSEERARWFLTYSRPWESTDRPNRKSTPVLLRGAVPRDRVIAVFLGRQEDEVFVRPEDVTDIVEIAVE